MLDSACSQYISNTVRLDWPANQSEVIPPSAITYISSQPGVSARQILIFENAPSLNKATMGKGIALVELANGRVFFFRTSMAVMEAGESLEYLLNELNKLPEWTSSWKNAADRVGFAIGAPLEFVDDDPQKLESWNIQGWKQHTSSRLVIVSATLFL